MARGLLVGLLACGCGRVGFEALADDANENVHACAGVTLVSSTCNSDSNVRTVDAILTNVTAGNLLLVAINADGSGFAPVVTDTLGTSFLPVAPLASNVLSEQVWYGLAAGTGDDTVTADVGSDTTALGVYVHELSEATVLEQHATATGTGLSPASPPIVTTGSGQLLFGHTVHEGVVTEVEGAFTQLENCTGDMSAYRIAATPGSYSVEFEASSSGAWLVTLASFGCP